MHPPLVTIIIPTFNQAKYLPACVDHCLFQTYSNLEIIIVDGGSDDDTKKYLSHLQKKIKTQTIAPVDHLTNDNQISRKTKKVYPQNRKLQIITFEEDIGATRTYNEGFKLASGKYCTYIVGDDLPHPHMIEEMVYALENNDVDFVYSDMNVVDDAGCVVRQMRLPDYSFKQCLADWFHLGVSKLYNTSLHTTAGIMDEGYTAANDYDHYLRFAMAGCRFLHIPKVMYSIRWHGKQRPTGQHTQDRYAILLEESRQCALRARKHNNKTNTDHTNSYG